MTARGKAYMSEINGPGSVSPKKCKKGTMTNSNCPLLLYLPNLRYLRVSPVLPRLPLMSAA